jgi:hypothetical protein
MGKDVTTEVNYRMQSAHFIATGGCLCLHAAPLGRSNVQLRVTAKAVLPAFVITKIRQVRERKRCQRPELRRQRHRAEVRAQRSEDGGKGPVKATPETFRERGRLGKAAPRTEDRC